MQIATYKRASTDKQENSVDSQDKILKSYADMHQMNIIHEYVDDGISGRAAEKRPAFMQMIEDSAKGDFDAVLVYDSSRFARNLEESIVYKSVLKKNGVALLSATEPALDDDSALLTDAMLGALNEMYSRKLSKAVKRGMVHAAQKGRHQTPPPYGYQKLDGKLVIDQAEAATVRLIFEKFIERPSWHGVAAEINGIGIRKRKAHGWYSRDIKRMLLNAVYIGHINYDGEIYKGNHDPIISLETWKKAQAIISDKPTHKQRPSSTYKHWLSGLMKCAHCGGRMNYAGNKKGERSYRCSKHANGGACKHSNFMSVGKLETLVHKAFCDLIESQNIESYAYFVPVQNKANQIDALQASLKKVHGRLNRFKAAYAEGIDSLQEYKDNKEQCLKEEHEILKEMALLKAEDPTSAKIEWLRTNVVDVLSLLFSEQYSIAEKSHAIKRIVDRIEFKKTDGTFIVYYFL